MHELMQHYERLLVPFTPTFYRNGSLESLYKITAKHRYCQIGKEDLAEMYAFFRTRKSPIFLCFPIHLNQQPSDS